MEGINLKAFGLIISTALSNLIAAVFNLSGVAFACCFIGSFIGEVVRKEKVSLANTVLTVIIVSIIGAWLGSLSITLIESLLLPQQAKLFPNAILGLLCFWLDYDRENVIKNVRRWFSRKSEGGDRWGGGFGGGFGRRGPLDDFDDFDNLGGR